MHSFLFVSVTTLLEEMGFRSDDAALQTRVDEESTKLDVKEATTQTTLVTSQIMPLEENDVVQESVYSPSPSLDDAEDVAFLEQFLVSKHESIPPDKFTLHVPELNRSTFDDTMELIPPFFYDGGVDRAHLPPPSFPSRCQNDEDGRCGSTTIASGGGIQEETIRINYDQINSADVLCGQGSGAITHCGNLAFRSWIAQYQPLYRSACPVKRAEIAEGIIDEIKKKGGRFLKRAGTKSEGNTQSWIDIGWKAAVDKTRQALREKIPAALLEPTSKNKKDDVTEEEERTWLPTTSPLASITSTPHFALLSGSLGIFEDDVLLGRGGITNEHIGTIVYRTMIREYHERYVSSSKRGKGKIVLAIVKGVTSVGGRFLRVKRGGIWAEVSGQNARESTRNALRQPW